MPGKSRHGKGKHPHHSKKSKAIQRQEAKASQQQVTVDASLKATPTDIDKAAPPKPAVVSERKKAIQYPFIIGELRRIGILAGIIMIILIILALVLS